MFYNCEIETPKKVLYMEETDFSGISEKYHKAFFIITKAFEARS